MADNETERVRVTIRVRPFTKAEEEVGEDVSMVIVNTDRNSVIVRRKGSLVDFTEFRFDAVLPPSATQSDVYNVAAEPVVLDVLDGYNGTVMAYGQTGAGKTHTLSDIVLDEAGTLRIEGIIPRSAAHILEISSNDKEHEYQISLSYIQIYMETIQDLLRPENSNLQIRETENGEIFVAGVEEIEVKSIEDVVTLLMLGDCNRRYSLTKMNAHSSRSHAIVIITVEKKVSSHITELEASMDGRKRLIKQVGLNEKVLVGKLFLVDLAGSERLKKSGAEGLRASEAMSVNMSLTTLGKCISARADPSVTHVPFRDSKLTRLLQESLGGNAKTSLIINVAPCSMHAQETLSSLQFGLRAMKVATRAIVNCEEEFRVIAKNIKEDIDARGKSSSPEVIPIEGEVKPELIPIAVIENREAESLKMHEEISSIPIITLHLPHSDEDGSENRLSSPKLSEVINRIKKQEFKDVSTVCKEGDLQKDFQFQCTEELLKEKNNLEVMVGSQLMANSATNVLRSFSLIDDFFTKK